MGDVHALLHAASTGDIAQLDRLMASGVPASSSSAAGYTAYHAAAMAGQVAVLQHLLQHAPYPDLASHALRSAVVGQQLDAVHILLESAALPDVACAAALVLAIHHGLDVVAMELLVQRPAIADTQLTGPNFHGRRPLHYAAYFGRSSIVQALLAAGASVNARQNQGRTPLHAAALGVGQQQAEAAQLLISSGARLWACDNAARTPLELAALHGNLGVAEAVLHTLPDSLHGVSYAGMTIISAAGSAAHLGHLSVFVAIAKAVGRHHRAGYGLTFEGIPIRSIPAAAVAAVISSWSTEAAAMQVALQQGRQKLAAAQLQNQHLLVQAVEMFRQQQQQQQQEQQELCQQKQEESQQEIQQHDDQQQQQRDDLTSRTPGDETQPVAVAGSSSGTAAVTAHSSRQQDSNAATLHAAAAAGNLQRVEQLLKAGAAVLAVDSQGLTAVQLAAQGGHLELVLLLVSALRSAGVEHSSALVSAAKAAAGTGQWTVFVHVCRGLHMHDGAAVDSLLLDAGAADVHDALAAAVSSWLAEVEGQEEQLAAVERGREDCAAVKAAVQMLMLQTMLGRRSGERGIAIG